MKIFNKKFNHIKRIMALVWAFLLVLSQTLSVSAEVTLPEGTVAGLPEDLMVLDSDGNSVSSDTGEYFFIVENMTPLVDYSKNIQITNLREDKSYHIYFYVEPLDKDGDIDLEEETTASFSLNDETFFVGKVTGLSDDGSIDLTKEPVDLGLYKPGETGKMNCTITWQGTASGGDIDNGHRLVDINGVHVLRDMNGKEYIQGEIRFKWIFYAVVEEDSVTNPPKTGILETGTMIYVVVLSALVLAIIMMLVAIKKRNHAE